MSNSQGIAKALIVHDLALTQELQGVAHVRVVNQTQEVVIGHARFLLCGEILVEIRADGVNGAVEDDDRLIPEAAV